MLHFFPPGMVERYVLFTFVAVLGVLQLVAARYRWAGLSLPGRRRWRWGYVLGTLLLGGAYLWFFGTAQPLIFQPGLAGAELFTVSALSTLLAVAATLGLVSVVHRPQQVQGIRRGERVELVPGEGMLYKRRDVDQGPAVITVSDLPDSDFPVSRLVNRLSSEGVLVLSIELATDGSVAYPEVLARLPAACAYLRERPDVDKRAIVLVGVGIGGDLALRTAATDPAIAAVTAIDPVLNPEATGLDLLRRSTFWQAVRWGKLRRRLADSLSAAERLLQLKGRPALLVFRVDSAPAEEIAAGNHAEVAIVHSDDEAIQRVARWLTTVTMNSKDVTRYQTVLPAK